MSWTKLSSSRSSPNETRIRYGIAYRRDAKPGDRSFVEVHQSFSVSNVRADAFGCMTHGKTYELATGYVLVGYPGDEYRYTHQHHTYGDECLSFHLAPELIDFIGGDRGCGAAARLPAPKLMVLGD